ncbi:uncharacterized protein LOC143099595 [Alosa pseudoharengus]|uniref:uncharacterized protein LOC143099595 n=1 Tax=Alosa pseudoharengus TaxID=34774 RepID=UPI003F8960BC
MVLVSWWSLQRTIRCRAGRYGEDIHSVPDGSRFLLSFPLSLQQWWKKEDTLIFAYSPLITTTKENFTSARMSVDPATPRTLYISHVHVYDEGIYICEAITLKHKLTQTWNLTIDTDDSLSPFQQICIMYAATSGIIGIIVFAVLCIYRSKSSS